MHMGTRWGADNHPSRYLIFSLITQRENLLAFMLLGDSAQTNRGIDRLQTGRRLNSALAASTPEDFRAEFP